MSRPLLLLYRVLLFGAISLVLAAKTSPTSGGGSHKKRRAIPLSSSSPSSSLRLSLWNKTAKIRGGGATTAAVGVGDWFRRRFRKGENTSMSNYEQEQLSSVIVERVRLSSGNTVLPPPLLEYAVRQSGLLGETLQEERVQKCASIVNRWYQVAGYPLHSMTGAVLDPTTNTAILTVKEPKLSNPPVALSFQQAAKKKKKKKQQQTSDLEEDSDSEDSSAASGVVAAATSPVRGRTRPDAIARALQLQPGEHFRWNMHRWQSVMRSGLFTQIHSASPVHSGGEPNDDAVQFQMHVTEAMSRSLDYGLSRSLYTGAWEGEFNAFHRNLWGSGETLGISIRKGANTGQGKTNVKDDAGADSSSTSTTGKKTSGNSLYKTPPTIRLSYTNDKFHLGNGYDVELFSEEIGEEGSGGGGGGAAATAVANDDERSSAQVAAEAAAATLGRRSSSFPQCRRGATLRLKDITWGPRLGSFLSSIVSSSSQQQQQKRWMQSLTQNGGADEGILATLSTSLEQTTSSPLSSEAEETMASVTLQFRPLLGQYWQRLRSSIETQVSVGTKVLSLSSSRNGGGATIPRGGSESSYNDDSTTVDLLGPTLSLWESDNFCPYASATVTARQILPLGGGTESGKKRPTELAMEHVLGTSTEHLPRHEARAMGIASKLRGYSIADAKSKPLQSYLRGTTELRIPVPQKLLSMGGKKKTSTTTTTAASGTTAAAEGQVVAQEEDDDDDDSDASSGLSLVLFGDYSIARPCMTTNDEEEDEEEEGKASVGIGFHQSLQGIPVKCELCMTSQHRKLGVYVSLGNSFTVDVP